MLVIMTNNKARANGKRFVYLAAGISALGGMLFGYDIGVISGAILFIKNDFSLSQGMEEIVVSSVLLGSLVGAAVGGFLADRIGRRRLLIITAAVFGVGAIGAALAPGTTWLLAARIVAGAAIGIASFVAPLYISEIGPVDIRGKLVSINQVALTSGIVISYLIDYAFAGSQAWRWMFAMAVIPATAFGVGLIFIPNSPRWLVSRGHVDQARAVLNRIRPADQVESELSDIQHSAAQQKGHWSELFSPLLRRAMIVGVGLAIAQQITGINTIIYYAPTIFNFAGLSSASVAILASVGVGVVNVALTIVAMELIDSVGRRPLLLASLAGMAMSLVVLGLAFAMAAIVRQPGMDSGGQPHGVRRFFRRRTRAGFLADTFGNLPLAYPRSGYECRDDRQLERQSYRGNIVFDAHTRHG
jgi:sugar porter (SP) family MFS transporter